MVYSRDLDSPKWSKSVSKSRVLCRAPMADHILWRGTLLKQILVSISWNRGYDYFEKSYPALKKVWSYCSGPERPETANSQPLQTRLQAAPRPSVTENGFRVRGSPLPLKALWPVGTDPKFPSAGPQT